MHSAFPNEARHAIRRARVQRGRLPRSARIRRIKRAAALFFLVIVGLVVYFRSFY